MHCLNVIYWTTNLTEAEKAGRFDHILLVSQDAIILFPSYI
jgi:hypothetical protein